MSVAKQRIFSLLLLAMVISVGAYLNQQKKMPLKAHVNSIGD